MKKEKHLNIPYHFTFFKHGVFQCEHLLDFFDWDIERENVHLDFRNCNRANYQALSLFSLYTWHLWSNKCHINFGLGEYNASQMWRLMGAPGWHQVLMNPHENFNGHPLKPLLAIRNGTDLKNAIQKIQNYTESFNIEYEKTLRYILSELLYNTIEHGIHRVSHNSRSIKIPSIIQLTWYKKRNELQFIIGDLGIGVKSHLEQAYPTFESDIDAIQYALKPNISGTFKNSSPYSTKDNAGVGLFISSNIMRKLSGNLYILSGNGMVHVSPADITSKTLDSSWPGTIVFGSINLSRNVGIDLNSMISDFRNSAVQELKKADKKESENNYYYSVFNYFGSYAEDKELAIKHRENKIIPAINEGKTIELDFSQVNSAPHSLINALLAEPIRTIGLESYKRIKIIGADPLIRQTIDIVFDDNTSVT